MSAILLGCSPLSWINSDIPELGKCHPIETILEQISDIGYKGVELEAPFKQELDKLPQLLKSNRLKLTGGWHSTYLLKNSVAEEKESLKKHLELLHNLDAECVILAECTGANHQDPTSGLSNRPILDEDGWERLTDGLDDLAHFAKSEGFTTAYHPHMGTVVQSFEDVNKLMHRTRSLGLLFDTGHLVYAGADPYKILDKHLRRVTHVHCKNIRPAVLEAKRAEDAPFFTAILDGIFTVPGDPQGAKADDGLDFRAIIQTLVERDYQGWIVMEAEQDPAKAHPYTYAEMGYQNLKDYLANAEVSLTGL